jgi:hypothetical protein
MASRKRRRTHGRCGKRRLSDAEYRELTLRGDTVPVPFPHPDGSFHFESLQPTSVGVDQEPFTYRTRVDAWLELVHEAGLCPAVCGWNPAVIHISWSDEEERQSREYASDIASSGL